MRYKVTGFEAGGRRQKAGEGEESAILILKIKEDKVFLFT
jgi:hypothetical protein